MNTTAFILIVALAVLSGAIIATRCFRRKKKSKTAPSLPSPNGVEDSTVDKENLKERILHAMVDEKIYLDKNLSLDKLAQKVHSNRYHVSQTIHKEFNMNFYQFINSARIKAFEDLLLKVGNLEKANLRDVARQVGFRSFNSFNNYFKEAKGMTPGEYKKSLRLPSLFQDGNIR